ncbi:MAG TPA: tRNA (adenosine(37)-N6)-threonylcarbamoyltransferase complex transferase subunit TsaD [Candidatus Limadaptatus stercorigallinarum]|uniref:tRNA N6-adenosine threonylcarbamoyltransferase n=1 Tax=Candidatus Limadaptatus stercorigallinarum TaxID=2840845 RepID=A0A9D1L2B3_9FIRM|nr:tRNA (adenosine(37)-N6)-threonylcarbamoyltransferase complex transferase subunit TsaD [Candidatus Limadaptatus stercorigallinarum]
MKILAIESSCDETAAAVVEDGRRVLGNVVASQIEIHRRFGGVVPEIASRNHTLAIDNVVGQALDAAGCGREDIDALAVTYGAGLLGALLVGVNYAKALAYAWKKPLYAVSHIRGHLAANYIDSGLEPPYVCLLASGGHTALLEVDGYEDVKLMGQSGDDAAGEAFDKVARVLGLPYPGGPEIQKLAREGSPVYKMPLPVFKTEGELKFSYSGLKTFVINLVHGMEQRGESVPKADVACSFQECAVEQLVRASECALRRTGMKKIAVAGGVSANERLRGRFDALGRELGAEVFYPQLRYCTDNAAMIGAAAYFLAKSGAAPAGAELDAKATVPLG